MDLPDFAGFFCINFFYSNSWGLFTSFGMGVLAMVTVIAPFWWSIDFIWFGVSALFTLVTLSSTS